MMNEPGKSDRPVVPLKSAKIDYWEFHRQWVERMKGRGLAKGVLDADIRSFFDTLDHEWLMKFIGHRIGDRRVLRQIRKGLNAGVLEAGQWTPQVQPGIGGPKDADHSLRSASHEAG